MSVVLLVLALFVASGRRSSERPTTVMSARRDDERLRAKGGVGGA